MPSCVAQCCQCDDGSNSKVYHANNSTKHFRVIRNHPEILILDSGKKNSKTAVMEERGAQANDDKVHLEKNICIILMNH